MAREYQVHYACGCPPDYLTSGDGAVVLGGAVSSPLSCPACRPRETVKLLSQEDGVIDSGKTELELNGWRRRDHSRALPKGQKDLRHVAEIEDQKERRRLSGIEDRARNSAVKMAERIVAAAQKPPKRKETPQEREARYAVNAAKRAFKRSR